jgi:hypothetical protein
MFYVEQFWRPKTRPTAKLEAFGPMTNKAYLMTGGLAPWRGLKDSTGDAAGSMGDA